MGKRIITRLGALGISAAAFIGFAVSSPSIAMATPTGCGARESGRAVVGTCSGGTGQFRIRADCRNAPDRTSPWTKPKSYTSVTCLVGHANSWTFEVK